MIEIENLKFYYKTYEKKTGFMSTIHDFFKRKYIKKQALNIDELNIKEGEIVGILGPNGAGKTTLIKILSGILEEKSGKVICDNFRPYNKNKEFLKNIGVVMGQKSQLIWDLPSIETLKLLKEIYNISKEDFDTRLDYFIELFNLKEKINVPVRKLSLGERRKFEIICSLIHNPKILFLDEPTIGLDI
ncbi:ATP-binding cassette domain-containing protein, partial [Oceanivirga salmonicida]